jgi:hypothetical protein
MVSQIEKARIVSYATLFVLCTTMVLGGAGDSSSYTAVSQSVPSTGGAAIQIMMDSSAACEGYVICISHDGSVVTLDSIDLNGTAAETAGAEFQVTNEYANGGSVGVVMDFTPPFDGADIPAGTSHVANFNYSCNNAVFYFIGDAVPATESTALAFEDDNVNNPPLQNMTVSGGQSVYPTTNDGSCGCEPVGVLPEDTTLWMETEFDGSEGNYAYHGQTGSLCFYYADEDDNIQGMTMTVCYDCDLTIGTEWDWHGSIVEQIGVEYLAVQVDDSDTDGDGCELVVAILLDALPPFDGQTLPQTEDLNEGRLLIGCLDVTVDDTAECDEDQEINWCNNINGNGNVNLYNNVVINYESIQDYARNDTTVYVVPEEIFQRGDCNSDDKVDLADAATILANQFNGDPIDCSDACDANDDGQLNMADSVYLLNWLFKFGPEPTAPGPFNDGPDPTDDSLPVCDSDDTMCP